MESFSLYQEYLDCSSVTQCVLGKFSSENTEIALAKHNLIELYTYEVPMKRITKLPLQGEIDSMVSLQHSNFERDLLVVAVKDAKLSTLQFNTSSNSFTILSLHSFENEKGIKQLNLMVDPEFRCLVGMLPNNKMFVIPVKTTRRHAKDEVYIHSYLGQEIYSPVFFIDLPVFPRQIELLRGHSDPVVGVMSSPSPLQLYMNVKFIHINFRLKEATLEAQSAELPGTCHKMIGLQPPMNGVLVLGYKDAYFVGNNVQREFSFPYYTENSTHAFTDAYKMFLLLCTGELLLLGLNYTENLQGSTLESVVVLSLTCQYQAYASKLLYYDSYLFVGSRIHNSFLLKFTNQEVIQPLEEEDSHKKRKLSSLSSFCLTKADELPGLTGAISAIAVERTRSDEETVKEILVCHGFGTNSYISRYSLYVNPFLFESFDKDTWEGIEEIETVWSISGEVYDLYVLISKKKETSVLKIEETIEEVTETTQFLSDVATVGTGRISPDRIYQACEAGIRILNNQAVLVKDFPCNGIWQVTSLGKYFCVLLMDGTVEVFKITDHEHTQLPPILGQASAVSLCQVGTNKLAAVGRPDGSLQVFDIKKGEAVLGIPGFAEGPALLNEEDNIDLSITDPNYKLPSYRSTEMPPLEEVMLWSQGDLTVLIARLSTNEVLVYQSFGNFKFSRVSVPVNIGHCDQMIFAQKRFYDLKPGIFVIHPLNNFWIVPDTTKNTLAFHVNANKGEVHTICSFHHSDCQGGFLYREESTLKISKVEEMYENSMHLPMLLKSKKCSQTPRHVLVHDKFIYVSFFTDNGPIQYQLKVYLFTEETGLKKVSNVQEFQENEVILSMCTVNFNRKLEPPYQYLAIGTGMVGTEADSSTGRILLFAIDNNRLVYQPLHKKVGLKGAISALGSIDGYLLIGVGSEIKIFTFVDEEEQEWLAPIAFYYGYTMAAGIDIQGNDVLCLDSRNQMYLLSFEEASSQKNLKLTGQYLRELAPITGAFHFNRVVVADEFKNLLIFSRQSATTKVDKIGDFHTGLNIFCFVKLNNALLMISQEGAVSALFISNEITYKKLHTLQYGLIEALPYPLGLNPRSYRLATTQERERQRKSVLDLGLVNTFAYLSSSLQRSIARNIGTSPHHILAERAGLPSIHHFLY